MKTHIIPRPNKHTDSPNPLKQWFGRFPKPMSQNDFAAMCGVSPSYVVALMREDDPPWPNRELQLRIAEVTEGAVTPNDFAGWDSSRKRRIMIAA